MFRVLRKWRFLAFLRDRWYVFAVLVFLLMFFVCFYTGWMMSRANINNWKSRSEKAAYRITRFFQEKLQETSNIMVYIGKQIMKDGVEDLEKVEKNVCSLATNILSTDWNNQKNDRIFTWSLFNWLDTEDQIRVSSRLGIWSEPHSMRHREYTQTCRQKPWTLQVCKPAFGVPSGAWLIPVAIGVQNEKGEHLGILGGDYR